MNAQELKPYGDKIRLLLEQTGTTRQYLSAQTKIPASIISRLITGKQSYCSEERVSKIIEFLESRK